MPKETQITKSKVRAYKPITLELLCIGEKQGSGWRDAKEAHDVLSKMNRQKFQEHTHIPICLDRLSKI